MKEKQVLIKMDSDKHLRFKMKCLGNGETMKNAVGRMVEYYLKKDDLGLMHEVRYIEKDTATRTCIMLDGSEQDIDIKKVDLSKSLYESSGKFFFACNEGYYQITDDDKIRLYRLSDYVVRLAKKKSEFISKKC